MNSIAAAFTARISSSGLLGTPLKNTFTMKGGAMIHIDSLKANDVIAVSETIGTISSSLLPPRPVTFEFVWLDLLRVGVALGRGMVV